jgi:hypothetical protein
MGDLGVRAFPLARGGSTPMAGKGDRTVTDKADAARPQASGRTGHQTSNTKKAKDEFGGISRVAKAGQTGC